MLFVYNFFCYQSLKWFELEAMVHHHYVIETKDPINFSGTNHIYPRLAETSSFCRVLVSMSVKHLLMFAHNVQCIEFGFVVLYVPYNIMYLFLPFFDGVLSTADS